MGRTSETRVSGAVRASENNILVEGSEILGDIKYTTVTAIRRLKRNVFKGDSLRHACRHTQAVCGLEGWHTNKHTGLELDILECKMKKKKHWQVLVWPWGNEAGLEEAWPA